jgi:hypothetical protein
MSTPLTVEALMELVSSCRRTITLGEDDHGAEWMRSSETMEVIDANDLQQGLQAILDARPQVIFGKLVGMTAEEASEAIRGRSPFETARNPITKFVLLLHPNRGAPNAMPGELYVNTSEDGRISGIDTWIRPTA